MVNQSNYWKLFRLSISGRVMIAKTYLISQATYLMGAIPIGDEMINSMNEIIIDFVNGNEKKIARERWFRSRERGGYGICDMRMMDLCTVSAAKREPSRQKTISRQKIFI